MRHYTRSDGGGTGRAGGPGVRVSRAASGARPRRPGRGFVCLGPTPLQTAASAPLPRRPDGGGFGGPAHTSEAAARPPARMNHDHVGLDGRLDDIV